MLTQGEDVVDPIKTSFECFLKRKRIRYNKKVF